VSDVRFLRSSHRLLQAAILLSIEGICPKRRRRIFNKPKLNSPGLLHTRVYIRQKAKKKTVGQSLGKHYAEVGCQATAEIAIQV